MTRRFTRHIAAMILFCASSLPGFAEPSHGIAMYGEPALPAGFANLPFVNPDAPKGGRIIFGEGGVGGGLGFGVR